MKPTVGFRTKLSFQKQLYPEAKILALSKKIQPLDSEVLKIY
jgi:hypothetical protein